MVGSAEFSPVNPNKGPQMDQGALPSKVPLSKEMGVVLTILQSQGSAEDSSRKIGASTALGHNEPTSVVLNQVAISAFENNAPISTVAMDQIEQLRNEYLGEAASLPRSAGAAVNFS